VLWVTNSSARLCLAAPMYSIIFNQININTLAYSLNQKLDYYGQQPIMCMALYAVSDQRKLVEPIGMQ